METASLALPTVNVGIRQYGRERARNVLDAEADEESILGKIAEARSNRFKFFGRHDESLWGRTCGGKDSRDINFSGPRRRSTAKACT